MSRLAAFNERVAVLATRGFGNVWAFYVLFVYGLMPLVFPGAIDRLLYWSNVIQLVALPLLAVGQSVMGRAGERQAKETHDTVMEERGLLLEDRELLRQELAESKEQREQLAQLVARFAPAAS